MKKAAPRRARIAISALKGQRRRNEFVSGRGENIQHRHGPRRSHGPHGKPTICHTGHGLKWFRLALKQSRPGLTFWNLFSVHMTALR